MKSNFKLHSIFFLLLLSAVFTSCDKDDDEDAMCSVSTAPDFSGTFAQDDQKGRPAINTVFVSEDRKDEFNTTIPSDMSGAFQVDFESRLLALNAGYTENALGLDAPAFTGVLAADVLGVSTTGTTTFFDGTNVLTGRNLTDDVIDVELLLIFGGPDGTSNPGLTSDNVDANDAEFSDSFPYLASPW